MKKSSNNNTDTIEDFEDLEDIFGEEVFTSFLNQEAEIQVGDKIYKYTDTGLFITNENDISGLNNYLNTNNISRNFLVPTDELVRIEYKNKYNPCGGYSSIEKYTYFVAPDEDCGGGSSSFSRSSISSSIESSSSNVRRKTIYEDFQIIANNLNLCSGSEPWFGNLFGTVKVCEDRYERRRRVKIKYWNINFGLGYSIGIKVKHQYRGWTGFWRRQKTDKVVPGINSVSWKFNRNYSLPSNISFPTRFYTYDGKLYESYNAYNNAVFTGQNIPIPPIPFAKNVDVVVEWLANDWNILDTEYKVRKLFYQQVYDKAKSILSTYNNKQLKTVVSIVHSRTETWVQYYDFSKDCSNCEKLDKIFDWGIATPVITYNLFQGFNWGNVQIKSLRMDFNNPDLTGLSIFGMAKRNGQWHGKRMGF